MSCSSSLQFLIMLAIAFLTQRKTCNFRIYQENIRKPQGLLINWKCKWSQVVRYEDIKIKNFNLAPYCVLDPLMIWNLTASQKHVLWWENSLRHCLRRKCSILLSPQRIKNLYPENATTLTGYRTGMQASREIYQNSMTGLTDKVVYIFWRHCQNEWGMLYKEFKECNEQLPLDDH